MKINHTFLSIKAKCGAFEQFVKFMTLGICTYSDSCALPWCCFLHGADETSF